MEINFTPDQELFIQAKLQTGKYHSAQEILKIALHLLDEYERADAKWIEDVREKIDTSASEQITPIDGATWMKQSLERLPLGVVEAKPIFGSARGLVKMSDDFDEPLEDFEEYAP